VLDAVRILVRQTCGCDGGITSTGLVMIVNTGHGFVQRGWLRYFRRSQFCDYE
jgi:hypothetical protein